MPATVEAPTREKVRRRTDRRTGGGTGPSRWADEEEKDEYDIRKDGPLEYLEDMMESREMDDPYHILLLGSTFEKPRVTVQYASSTLTYVLEMPDKEAFELSSFAAVEGMSCLGTWSREQCLDLGKQLQIRDLVCRVVPFAEGGQRGWQAKDADYIDVPSRIDSGFE